MHRYYESVLGMIKYIKMVTIFQNKKLESNKYYLTKKKLCLLDFGHTSKKLA